MRRCIPNHAGLRLLAVAPLALFFGACLPYVADQQSARLLEPGGVEVTPSFSTVSFSNEGETEHVQDHFGLRLGYGVTPAVELRGAYERVSMDDDMVDASLNMLGFGLKMSVVPDQVALFIPVGVIFGEDVESSDTWTIAPTLLATWRASNRFELTPSAKLIYPFAAEDPEALLGFHLGAGISSDLDRWAIRPELGAVINPGDDGTGWGFTLGFSFRP